MTHVIPESVRRLWNEYIPKLRGKEIEETGDDKVTDVVEKVGWGVEEAQERHQAEASEFDCAISSVASMSGSSMWILTVQQVWERSSHSHTQSTRASSSCGYP